MTISDSVSHEDVTTHLKQDDECQPPGTQHPHLPAHEYTLTDTAFSPLNCNICDNPPWYVMKAEGKQDICVILLHLMHLNYK